MVGLTGHQSVVAGACAAKARRRSPQTRPILLPCQKQGASGDRPMAFQIQNALG
jgi:hypothetical protein